MQEPDAPSAQAIRFAGRILFLSADPGVVARQVAGEDVGLAEAQPLRDDISTDEITPLPSLVHFDDEIGRHAHIGFSAGGALPIPLDGVRAGGFRVIVGGKRYGKGSSREHSPLAELTAGIRLVIAESFERIYRQNCDNLGLFTSRDFGLIDRIRAGEAIPVAEFVAGRDSIAARVLAAGGLLAYGETTLPVLRRLRPRPRPRRKPWRRRLSSATRSPFPTRPGTRSPGPAASCGRASGSFTRSTPPWPRTDCTDTMAAR